MKFVKASLCILLIAPIASVADEPATAPASPPAAQSRSPLNQLMGPQEVMDFLQEHAPNRLDFLNRMPEDGQGRRRLLRFWGQRLSTMSRLKDTDTELYLRMVHQFELQDQAIGMVRKSKFGEPPSKELRDIVTELVRTGISLREQRIAKLEKQLQNEKEKLKADQQNEDKLVDQQLESLRKEGKELVKRMGPENGTINASPESRH
jgi:hypothetical protein